AFGIAKAANKGNSPYITEPKEAVLPPSQVGTDGVQHAKIRAYSLSSALENSKAACIITVGNWLSEDLETSSTYFEAEVNEVICGSVPAQIVLCQYGDSKFTIGGSPLFTYGDKLLVFLREVNWGSAAYENCYAPVGVDTSFFYIAEIGDGARYAVNHNCVFSYNLEAAGEGAGFRDLAGDRAVLEAVISAIAEHDAAAASVIAKNAANSTNEFPLRIYRAEEITERIKGLG
ncbi:MAG: hypothetical protein J6P98_06345, partial [Clostridia bacterium]|nr:hypothetical protein [Clostridia bacterium]